MRLDHLSYVAGPEGLAACVQRLGSNLGAGFTDGGIHPTFGTRNFVLPLADGCYLEVVQALDHPAADHAPFGRAVRDRASAGGGWLAWAIRVDDIVT
ncbi:MAG: VOC family protein, partial [Actinomycetota bacterium]|nr:VOC family protein [Actinomycetota bacterium]